MYHVPSNHNTNCISSPYICLNETILDAVKKTQLQLKEMCLQNQHMHVTVIGIWRCQRSIQIINIVCLCDCVTCYGFVLMFSIDYVAML